MATTKKTPKKTTKRKKPARQKVTGSIAVLSALSGGATTVKEIATGTSMTTSAVSGAVYELRKKSQIRRTNPKAKGFAVIATYKITGKGSTALRKAKKEMGI